MQFDYLCIREICLGNCSQDYNKKLTLILNKQSSGQLFSNPKQKSLFVLNNLFRRG